MPDMNEWISNASLQVYESGIHVRDQMHIEGRSAPFYVMSYVQQGEAELRARGSAYRLGPSSVILIPPQVKHDHIKLGEKPTVFMWWHFDYRLYETLDLLRLLGLPMVFTLEATKDFEDTFAQYTEIMQRPMSLQNTIIQKASAMMVMAYLLGAAQEEEKRQVVGVPECFRAMLEMILSHQEAELDLKAFAERFHMHPTYLSNRFKHYYGIAPIALHRKVLLQRAQDMLGVQGMSVMEVADALGFGSASAFSRFFSQKMGIPPSKVGHRSP